VNRPLPSSSAESVELSGSVERVVFHNEENGYTVLRLVPDGKKDAIAVVGRMSGPVAGASLRVRGAWHLDPRWGRQVRMDSYEEAPPVTDDAICLYLASGLIKGVRESLAQRIVRRFGADTLRILDEEPQRLREVPGVGPKNLAGIIRSRQEHRGMRDLMLFLRPHGVSASYAVRIYRHYGRDALEMLRENPYRPAMDIRGIGFSTADGIAGKLGFGREHPLRVRAGLLHVLRRLGDEGHVYFPRRELAESAGRELDVDPRLADEAVDALLAEELLILEHMDGEDGIFLKRFHHYETKIAFFLTRILRSPKSARFAEPDALIDGIVEKMPLRPAPEQIEAIRCAAASKVMVLTGGPGTGKTTIINAVLRLFAASRARILLAAPTGRAAKRLAESTEREAKTVHRLLEYSPKDDAFSRNENNPLACGLLVVDEASMMDTQLAYHLFKAVPLGATLILVGDVNQLPSVGPGNVLKDIIASGVVPIVELKEVFRQAASSGIVMNAHAVNRGEIPAPESGLRRFSDFYFFRESNPEKAAALIVDLVKNRIPQRFDLDPLDDVQVLTPMHKGSAGAANLNLLLQEALNPRGRELQRGERRFRLGDKVMQIRNNYEKDVYNGDIGRIVLMDFDERCLTVRYDERNAPYAWEELDEIVPAYAISVHKSQGSEYPAVVMPLLMQHYVLLQRNLLYTGVTRGKKLVVLVGENRALAAAVKNNRTVKRHTRLARRLR
jgi:exodeoxyribonuclease V alpha subunit